MYNPRDFIPTKYKKNIDKVSSSSDDEKPSESIIDSPWSDLAKEPQTPEYRSNITLSENGIKNELNASSKLEELKEISQEEQTPSSLNLKNKSSNKKKLTGLLMVFFLVIGGFASYMLSQQNQDNRQQASTGSEDPYPTDNSCGTNMTRWSDGYCRWDNCRATSNGKILCGYITDQDACTEQSMGGDWCDNPNTSRVENCEESGLMRCQCSAGWWVIGKAPSCSELCGDANADCDDCPTPTPPPGGGGGSGEPTPTPTPPAELLACGTTGCTQNDDCQNGLTCQSVTVNSQSTGICAKGENQLFCAANPTTDNCCISQAMPVCASIEMLDASNNLMTGDADKNLKVGDEVRFRCNAVGNQDVDFDYQFRIWDKSTTTWVDITDSSGTVAKNISDTYKINNFSKHVVQGRICWGTECQVWEIVEGAPTTKGEPLPLINDVRSLNCFEENAIPCADGYICSATPAGGCPSSVTVNGEELVSACARTPSCMKAEGIECETVKDCFDGYSCQEGFCTKQ